MPVSHFSKQKSGGRLAPFLDSLSNADYMACLTQTWDMKKGTFSFHINWAFNSVNPKSKATS